MPFEKGIALERVNGDQVLELLDYPTFFTMRQLPLPQGRNEFSAALWKKNLVPRAADRFDITNLGAILFARDLRRFEGLKRKCCASSSTKPTAALTLP
jgi:predicted HTH transcriptional regulator